MSTFPGPLIEFPYLRVDDFTQRPNSTSPPALACFLTHIHTDHLRGLLTHRSPFIYCTSATRSLLLRLERRFHRLNFARSVLESRLATYRHLKRVLRPLLLRTPTEIELCPGKTVRVTAVDANHCVGSCMFLFEGDGRAVLFTGDVRCEKWFVEGLGREPSLMPFVMGIRRLDRVYLDTTLAAGGREVERFEGKGEGVRELFEKVEEVERREGRGRTRYFFHAWTWGYEGVLVALAGLLGSRVHVDEYRWRLYGSMLEGENRDLGEAAPLVGFREGNRWQSGCLTRDDGEEVRIHACEKGMGCEILKDENVVQIMPIVTRYKGVEYMEIGVGGGHGDLELNDLNTVGTLMELCHKRLPDRPDILEKITNWLEQSVQQGASNVKLDTEAFYDALEDGSQTKELEEVPLDRLIMALERLVSEKKPKADLPSNRITFPYSRHASLEELRLLVGALRPKAVYPNTYEPGMDMDKLFGDLLLDAKPDTEVPLQTCEAERPEADEESSMERGTPGTGGKRTPEFVKCPATGFLPEEALMIPSPGISQSQKQTAQGPGTNSKPHSRKRYRSKNDLVDESIKRRMSAYQAVLSSDDGSFTGLDLASVSGYHNAEQEVEL
ncbi:hypothetical protein C1H76_1954 [Elsinoe australis]|uniref:Metallo-beta-lactamase domain-containing protein n=1 Tax=Elsinoe australis TaxID=40998 RepID=A0A4U7B3D1_9PEZI|nr:hypothetical protein C1H76_1954 [Elsinoe australis]